MGTILSAAAIALLVNVLTTVCKNYIKPKFGDTGIHVFAFVLATIGAWYFLFGAHIKFLQEIVMSGAAIFSLAVTFYEVLLSKLGGGVGAFFKAK